MGHGLAPFLPQNRALNPLTSAAPQSCMPNWTKAFSSTLSESLPLLIAPQRL